ncbi:MAG: hypothetical protein Q8O55_01435 [Dehalococcoidales bacterium]|nr:hypothetical protein [Dehalococcoidales bacterium]
MDIGLHVFKSQIGMFDPFALPEHNVCVHYQGSTNYRFVDYMEAIPPFQCINLGALAAGTRSGHTNITNLEMYDDEFGLYRWYPLDNAQIYMFLPSGVGLHFLRNLQVPVDYKTMQRDPNLVSTEIVVWQINRPAIEAVNGMAYPLAAVRLVAMGYRFHSVALPKNEAERKADKTKAEMDTVEEIKAGKAPVTHVYASGLGRT